MFNTDEYFMKKALLEAEIASEKNEVPVGCVITHNQSIIVKAHNLTETLTDVTAHAEMQAFTSAANYIGGKYLKECTLYVTLEPCIMCAGAAYWTQISKIVFGAFDTKRGFTLSKTPILHPKTQYTGGILEHECAALLQSFFKNKRKSTN